MTTRRVIGLAVIMAAFATACKAQLTPSEEKRIPVAFAVRQDACDKTSEPAPVEGSRGRKDKLTWVIDNRCTQPITVCITSLLPQPPVPLSQEDPLDNIDDNERADKRGRCTDVENGKTDMIKTQIKENAGIDDRTGRGRYSYHLVFRIGDIQKETDPMIEIVR